MTTLTCSLAGGGKGERGKGGKGEDLVVVSHWQVIPSVLEHLHYRLADAVQCPCLLLLCVEKQQDRLVSHLVTIIISSRRRKQTKPHTWAFGRAPPPEVPQVAMLKRG
jgi:hypothetical protein